MKQIFYNAKQDALYFIELMKHETNDEAVKAELEKLYEQLEAIKHRCY